MIKINKGLLTGIKFFIVHFCVEIVCFTTLRHHFPDMMSGIFAFAFDMAAFLPQALFGEFMDKHRKIPGGTIGVLMMASGVFISTLSVNGMKMTGIIIMALGNAVLHEQGALKTVADGDGKIFPSALFVAGGSFGLVTGQTMGRFGVSLLWLIIPLIITELIIIFAGKIDENTSYPEFCCVRFKDADPHSSEFPIELIITAAFIVTAVRSFLGYAIPISWKKEVWQDFLLFFVMGIGKAAGGYLADKFGARRTGVISTLISIPFLAIGADNMVISVIGVCLFSMTMCITFEMILSVLPENPGLAFGTTTCALFIGSAPVFFVQPEKKTGIVLIIIFSILCSSLIYFTCNNNTKNKSDDFKKTKQKKFSA